MTTYNLNEPCLNTITSSLLFILTIFAFVLILRMKIVDFKNSVQFAMKVLLGYFIAFFKNIEKNQ